MLPLPAPPLEPLLRPRARLRAAALAGVALLMSAVACQSPQLESDDDDDGSSGTAQQGAGGHSAGGGPTMGVGGSGGAELPPACDPYVPRPTPPEVIIGPVGLEQKLVGLMNGAQSHIALSMYQLDCDGCVAGLIAAQQRGVTVRVQLDEAQFVNSGSKAALVAAGIEVRDAPDEFNHFHPKVMIIDDELAVVMSANMNGYSMYSERNFGVVDHDPQDVADLAQIFERDWVGRGELDFSCTRLIVVPDNGRPRITALINGANDTLDLALMYLSDDNIRSAVLTRAAAGVQVRALLASPGWIDSNTATAAELQTGGVQSKFLTQWELHAKLIIADGVALVGSANMSWNSLTNNREVNVLVTEPEPTAAIAAQFEADWNIGVTP